MAAEHFQLFEECRGFIRNDELQKFQEFLTNDCCKRWIRMGGLNREGMICPETRVAQKTLLHLACQRGKDVFVRLLLEANASPNVKAEGLPGMIAGETPLHMAVMSKNITCVKLLLESKARQDTFAQDSSGKTPLHVAAGMKDGVGLVKLMLSSGADLKIKDNNQRTALQYAKEKKCKDVENEFVVAEAERKRLSKLQLSPFAPFATKIGSDSSATEQFDEETGDLLQPVFVQLRLIEQERIIDRQDAGRSISLLKSMGLTNAIYQLKNYEFSRLFRNESRHLCDVLRCGSRCHEGIWQGLRDGKPFGFVRSDMGDLFAHKFQIRDVDSLVRGQRVIFEVGFRNEKREAQNVRAADAGRMDSNSVDVIWVTNGSLEESIPPFMLMCTKEEASVMLEFGGEVQKQNSLDQPFLDKYFPIPEVFGGLPDSCLLFSDKAFDKPEISAQEAILLGNIKSLLDEKDINVWKQHTSKTLITADVVKTLRKEMDPEMCTKAFAKMYEMLCAYDLVVPQEDTKHFNTLHLCEAPGAFVCATNHYIRSRFPDLIWNWRACSLNPYFEGNNTDAMIDDDKFINESSANWYFGCDDTGDMRLPENIQGAIKEVKSLQGPLLLVTADGSVDCSGVPNEQEDVTAQLHYCESVAAIGALELGGCFVLKMFMLFEHTSVGLVYLLRCLFDDVSVCKPVMSTPGNSETYVVARGFLGISPQHFEVLLKHTGEKWAVDDEGDKKGIVPLRLIACNWMDKMVECSKYFSRLQGSVIKRNLRLFDEFTREEGQAVNLARTMVAQEWIRRFRIERIERSKRIASNKILQGTNNRLGAKGRERDGGSLAVRVDLKEQRKRIREGATLEVEVSSVGEDGLSKKMRLSDGAEFGVSGVAKEDGMVMSEFAKRQMEKMGFKTGEGLGKTGQGIQAPVQAVVKADYRAGISYSDADRVQGHELVLSEPSDVVWIEHRMVMLHVDVEVLIENASIKEGKRLLEYQMSKFCAQKIVLELLEARDSLIRTLTLMERPGGGSHSANSGLKVKEIAQDTLGCYTVGVAGFASRSALKLADLSRLCQDLFVGIRSEAVSFLDLHGGRGGYSDYIMFRLGMRVEKGLMFKVRERPSPVIEGFKAASLFGETTMPLEIVDIDGSFSMEELDRIVGLGKGLSVSFVVGNGVQKPGADHPLIRSVESISTPRLLFHCIVALETLQEGGVFVCRTTDILGRCAAGVLLLLSTLFDRTTCVKPDLSCPAKSERFLVGVGFLGRDKAARAAAHLRRVLGRMRDLQEDASKDVVALVHQRYLMEGSFVAGLIKMNERDCAREVRFCRYLQQTLDTPSTATLAVADAVEVLARLGLTEISHSNHGDVNQAAVTDMMADAAVEPTTD